MSAIEAGFDDERNGDISTVIWIEGLLCCTLLAFKLPFPLLVTTCKRPVRVREVELQPS